MSEHVVDRTTENILKGVQILSTSLIQIGEVRIQETIAVWAEGNYPNTGHPYKTIKLIWVRDNLGIWEMEGKPNFLFHKDFKVPLYEIGRYFFCNQGELNARQKVCEAFEEHWGTLGSPMI